MVNNFWKKKKVLITGDTGFKGSWLTCILLKSDCYVYGVSLEPDDKYFLHKKLIKDKEFNQFTLNNKYIHADLDINCRNKLKDLVLDINPDIIFHLAAQPLVRQSYLTPVSTWETNVIGTINLLEALRELNKCSIVIITTDKVYENIDSEYSFKESDHLGGLDPYSSSKAAVELVVNSWRKSFYNDNLIISTARAGNVIGGGDWSENRIIPDIIKSIISKEKLSIRYPNAIRPWQHVLDPLFGYIMLAEKQINNHTSYSYNFGPKISEYISVKELIKRVTYHWGEEVQIEYKKEKEHESSFLSLDIEKATKELGWQPRWNFDKTIISTVNWYKEVLAGRSCFECISNDIMNFKKQHEL